MENEVTKPKEPLFNQTVVRSRSPLFEFITKKDGVGGEDRKIKSNFNPYRTSEHSFFSLIKGTKNPKRPAELTDQKMDSLLDLPPISDL